VYLAIDKNSRLQEVSVSDIRLKPPNRLLAALPAAELTRIMPALEHVDLRLGEILHEAGGPQKYFYFPGTCIVSLIGELNNGDSAELSLIGREGGVGLALVLGGGTTTTRATVQSAGTALRWKAAALQRELKLCGAVLRMLLRYTQSVWTQTAQSALCNRHHSLEQQLCRWLLLSLDRVDGSQIRMTQQLIADMLGVRREGVVLSAKKLQRRGWISYSRGVITVLNRTAMEGHVCECYQAVNAEYRRLVGGARVSAPPGPR
jgi:CRP-like cAMP-binding protein